MRLWIFLGVCAVGLILALIWAGTGFEDFHEAKNAVRQTLRDPRSAQFRNVQDCPTGRGVTGEFNAKNAYGGYTEFEPFLYVDGKLALTGSEYGFSFQTSLKKCYGKFAS